MISQCFRELKDLSIHILVYRKQTPLCILNLRKAFKAMSANTSPPFRASDHFHDTKPHLLLCTTGSVATIKLPQILHALSSRHLSIRILCTPSSTAFLAGQSSEQPTLSSLLEIRNVDGLYLDHDEWTTPWVRNNPILHIELRRWADLMIVAPASANFMAKVVGGHSDGLATSVVRAWDTEGLVDKIRFPIRGFSGRVIEVPAFDNEDNRVKQKVPANYGEEKLLQDPARPRKRIIMAPAMNTAMWRQPVTRKHIKVLEEEWGVGRTDGQGWIEVLRPQEKELACGDVGDGAMRKWEEIVEIIEERLGLEKT